MQVNLFNTVICLMLLMSLLMFFPFIRRLISTPQFKNKLEIIQSFFTMAAIVVGGIWTYNSFLEEQTNYPEIEQKVYHLSMTDPDHFNLLRVDIKLSNKGNTKLVLNDGGVWIQQVRPLLPCSSEEVTQKCAFNQINDALTTVDLEGEGFSWPMIFSREMTKKIYLEPGETDNIDFEFVISSDVKVILVYSFLGQKDELDSKIGWSKRVYNFFYNSLGNKENKQNKDKPVSENVWSKSEIHVFKLAEENKQRKLAPHHNRRFCH